MKTFEIHNQLKANNNNQVNVISNCPKGYYVITLIGRLEVSEMEKINERKFYASLQLALKSEQLKKYPFATYTVINNKITKIK